MAVISRKKKKKLFTAKRIKNTGKVLIAGALFSTIASGIGYGALGPINFTRHAGQYWQYIDDKNNLVSRLNGEKPKEIEASEWGGLFSKRPDPAIIKEWPVSDNNSVRILTSDKEPVELLKIEPSREFAKTDEIPEVVKRALTLVEDKNFYEHNGINFRGKLRGIYQYLKGGRITAGSGITEQVAKAIFTKKGQLSNREGSTGILSKLAEMLYALKIDSIYTKDDILTFHQNVSYFGDGSDGIKPAAHGYFGKELNELTLCEALFLERLIQNPGKNPKNGGDKFQRKKYLRLLEALRESGDITEKEYGECKLSTAINLNKEPRVLIVKSKYPSATATLVRELREKYNIDVHSIIKDAHRPYSIDIYSTIELDEIRRMEVAVNKGLKHKTANLGFVVLDNRARIVGIIAGRNFTRWSDFNRAVQTNTQAGSTIKPLIYAIGYNEDIVLPSEIFIDSKDGVVQAPDNWDDIYDREMTLEEALDTSNNVITRKVWDRVKRELGFDGILKYFENVGLDPNNFNGNPNDTTIALGSKGGSPLEIASAYSTLFDGTRIPPTIIERIVIGNTEIIPKRERKKIFRRLTVDAVKRSLRPHGERLTSSNYISLKTGTTNGYKEAWTAGVIDDSEGRAFALLVMNDNRRALGTKAYGRVIAQPIIKLYVDQYLRKTVYKTRKYKPTIEAPIEIIVNELSQVDAGEAVHVAIDDSFQPKLNTDIPDAGYYDAGTEEAIEETAVVVIDDTEKICNLYNLAVENRLNDAKINDLYRLRSDMLDCLRNVDNGTESWAYYSLVSAEAAYSLSRLYILNDDKNNGDLFKGIAREGFNDVLERSNGFFSSIHPRAEGLLKKIND